MKKNIFLILCFVSVIFNILFFRIGIYPVVKERIKNKLMTSSEEISDYNLLEQQIIDASLEMMVSDEHYMPFEEHDHFLEELHKISEIEHSPFAWFDHPKGLLFSGMAAFAESRKDTSLMREVARNFDAKILDNWEKLRYMVIVDQIPFGVTAVHLYRFYGDEKYRILADELYRKTREMISRKHDVPLIFYRNNQDTRFYIVDTLGMICPFLIHYGKTFGVEGAIELALAQLEYYSDYGLDADSGLPSHAVYQPEGIRIGPHNWGRGVGWYFFPVSEFHRYIDKERFADELGLLTESIRVMQNGHGLWNQFLGVSKKFDASATVMYMYGFNNFAPGTYSREEVYGLLKPHIYDGVVGPTSGGAFGINDYSRSFGMSELTQGIFLKLLSTVDPGQ